MSLKRQGSINLAKKKKKGKKRAWLAVGITHAKALRYDSALVSDSQYFCLGDSFTISGSISLCPSYACQYLARMLQLLTSLDSPNFLQISVSSLINKVIILTPVVVVEMVGDGGVGASAGAGALILSI